MRRAGAAALAAAILGGLILAAGAGAGVGPVDGESLGHSHGLRYMLGKWDPFNGHDIVVLTPCGETTDAAVGGGAEASGKASKTRISSSRGEDHPSEPDPFPDDYWFGEGQQLSQKTRSFKVYAICRIAGVNGLDFEDAEVTVGDGDTASVSVGCIAGTSVIGGGFNLTDGNVVRSLPADGADADDRADDGWRVKARNLAGDPTDLAAEAICLDNEMVDVNYRSDSAKVKAGKSKSLSASCPNAKSVSGGGFSIKGSADESFVHSLRPRDADDGNDTPDDRWEAEVVNGTNKKRGMTVTAICVA